METNTENQTFNSMNNTSEPCAASNNENVSSDSNVNIVPETENNETPADNKNKPVIKKAPQKIYSKKDIAAAILCAVPGYMFVKYVFWQPYTLYAMIFNFIVLAIILFYIKASKGKLKPSHIFLFTLSFIFNLTFLITDNSLPKILAGIYSYGLTAYTLFLAAGGREAFERGFIAVFLKAVLFIPFRGFEDAPKAVSCLFKEKKSKKLGQIGAGILLGVPLTFVVGFLLINADDGFGKILSDIFENFNIYQILDFAVPFMFSLPVIFFLFGMLYANYSGNNKIKNTRNKINGIFPPFMLYSAVTPVCLLYVLFFFTQLNYFISAFRGVLPAEFSYSQYARQGFFELCAVVVINIFILIIMNTLCKKEDGKKYSGIRIYSGITAFFTIVLIITAISKMIMYINVYGLSPLRVYTSWFMLLLVFIFIVIIIWGFILKLNFYKPVFAVFTVMFGFLCFADIDGFIAKYNIDMYKSGQVKELDVELLYDLSDSAVKYAVELRNDPKYSEEIKLYLNYKYSGLTYSEWYEWNTKTNEAQNIIFKNFKYNDVIVGYNENTNI